MLVQLELDITHNGGDGIDEGDLRITVQDSDDSPYDSGSTNYALPDDDTFGVGDTITISGTQISGLNGDKEVQVIHVPSDSIILDTEVEFDDGS